MDVLSACWRGDDLHLERDGPLSLSVNVYRGTLRVACTGWRRICQSTWCVNIWKLVRHTWWKALNKRDFKLSKADLCICASGVLFNLEGGHKGLACFKYKSSLCYSYCRVVASYTYCKDSSYTFITRRAFLTKREGGLRSQVYVDFQLSIRVVHSRESIRVFNGRSITCPQGSTVALEKLTGHCRPTVRRVLQLQRCYYL